MKYNDTHANLGTAGKSDAWKTPMHVSQWNAATISRVAVGFRHTAVIDCGLVYSGKFFDDDFQMAKLGDEQHKDLYCVHPHKFLHVSCGLDYTLAMDASGKLFGWGSSSLAQVSD